MPRTNLRNQLFKSTSIVVLTVFLSACQFFNLNPEFAPDPVIESRIFGPDPVEIPDTGLIALGDEIRAYLDAHVPAGLSGWDLVIRLQDLLFSPDYLNIRYDDTANLNAAGVFREQRANCLSLVSLYIAMARHYNLDVRYQTVQVRPSWDRRGELMVLSEHINALGRLGSSERYIMDFTPEIRLQRNTAKTVSDQQALALFFNNLAVQHLIDSDLQGALQHSRYAVMTDPTLDLAWNNMGSILSRLGEPELAEYSYQKASWLNRANPSAINNLARFYALQGDQEKARMYARAVESHNRRNPYYHYILGSLAYEKAEYQEAIGHFQQAIRRNDLEPDFYLALGMAHRGLGDEELADQLTQLAVAVQELGDQTYRVSQARLRRVDTRTILRSTSAGFTVEFVD